jgi:hypothetical protein
VLKSRFGNRWRARLKALGAALSPMFRKGRRSLQAPRILRRPDGAMWPPAPPLPLLRQALLRRPHRPQGFAMRTIVGRLVQRYRTGLIQASPAAAEE